MNETIQQKVTPSCVSAPAPRKVYVIGHKNPDTDSICSAIAYADIKRRTEEGIFEAKRAGQISQETQYVLDRFQVDPPGYVPNVAPRVKDMEAKRPAGHLSPGFHRRAEKLPARAEPQRLHPYLGPEAGRRT